MSDPGHEVPLPKWFHGLGFPAWACDARGVLRALNPRAEALLGRRSADCAGRPCHQVIEATDPWGQPLCAPRCRIRILATEGVPVEPLRLCVLDSRRREHWLRMLMVRVVRDDGEPAILIHCACDDARLQRLEEYMERIASGPRPPHEAKQPPSRASLTAREREVLRRLDRAQSLQQIANGLGLSYVTVRNHVQHILTKLQAHSIREAVARDLLDSGRWRRSESGPDRPPGSGRRSS
jgi:DNA-binding CsgD family transcriptional regulator